MSKKIIIFLFIIYSSIIPKFIYATVIFETNFDNNPDWNTNGEFEGNECSIYGIKSSTNACSIDTYPAGWNGYRAVPALNYPTFHPSIQIGTLPQGLQDHSGTGSGKAMIVYNESYPAYNNSSWPGDGILAKYFGGNTYPEIYVQFWMKTQSGWQWAGPDAKAVKFFRAQFWPAENSPSKNIFQMTESSPSMIFDMGHWSDILQTIASYRCDQNDYYCTNLNSKNNFQKIDTSTKVTSDYADGNWHKWEFHLKMNDAGIYNGIFFASLDGLPINNENTIMWRESGSTVSGWSDIMLGGNSYNDFATQSDQWYSIDDFIVSTSPIGNENGINSIKINFSDISSSFAKTDIEALSASGIIQGFPDGTFRPENMTTRSEFLGMSLKALNVETNPDQIKTDFTDIPQGASWMIKYAQKAKDLGIIEGQIINGKLEFRPNDPITRAEAVSILLKSAKIEVPEINKTDFTDIPNGASWMIKYAQKAKDLGIIEGQIINGKLEFRPNDPITRAETSRILIKVLKG